MGLTSTRAFSSASCVPVSVIGAAFAAPREPCTAGRWWRSSGKVPRHTRAPAARACTVIRDSHGTASPRGTRSRGTAAACATWLPAEKSAPATPQIASRGSMHTELNEALAIYGFTCNQSAPAPGATAAHHAGKDLATALQSLIRASRVMGLASAVFGDEFTLAIDAVGEDLLRLAHPGLEVQPTKVSRPLERVTCVARRFPRCALKRAG